jgi:hypothetical protein
MLLAAVLLLCSHVRAAASSFRIVRVDTLTVRTTLRLWNDLHVAAGTAHDFEYLFAPAQTSHEFVAAVLNDEVHALGRGEVGRSTQNVSLSRPLGIGWRLDGVAHAPHRSEAATELVRMIAADGAQPHPQMRERQPRWCVAMAFYREGR